MCRRLALVLPLVALGLQAAVIPVKPGDPLQAALDRAGPGDTVRLAAGVHRQRVIMERSGRFGAPVILEGEPGAVLDGSEPATPDWQPAPDVCPGAWQTALPFEPFTVTADGRILTLLQESKVDPANTKDPNWQWPKLFRDGVGPSHWDGVKALAMWRGASHTLLVRFKGDLDPHGLAWTFAPRRPAVWISGADRCVVRNLAVRNAAYGVLVEESLGSVVEGCTLGPVDYGVWLGPGSQQCTVRYNEILMAPYAGADPKGPGAWDNWQAHKVGGFSDRCGVQIRHTAGGHEVHDNDIHDTWDGIEDVGAVGENAGLRIHHNRIRTVNDDGLEPNGAEEDCEWHDNLVQRCICGFRIKAPRRGPLYAYGNLFFGNSEDFRNFGEVDLSPAWVYVYHNTCTSGAAVTSNKVFGIGTPNYHYLNNLFWCATWWGNAGKSVDPNWHTSHNVFVRRGTDRRWTEGMDMAKRLGLDSDSRFVEGAPGFADVAGGNVALLPDSPARQAGGDLRQLLGRDLPGLPPGPTPDTGALAYGEPMPTIPRRPQDVAAPIAGTWPPADAHRTDPWTGPDLLQGSAGFEDGLNGWDGTDPASHRLTAEQPAAGAQALRTDATARQVTASRPLPTLEPGAGYALVYRSRASTIADFRVIVRNRANAQYLANGSASPGRAWRRTVLRFTAPAGPVGLELSPRGPGVCELDDICLYRVR